MNTFKSCRFGDTKCKLLTVNMLAGCWPGQRARGYIWGRGGLGGRGRSQKKMLLICVFCLVVVSLNVVVLVTKNAILYCNW